MELHDSTNYLTPLSTMVAEYKDSSLACHHIPTKGSSIHVLTIVVKWRDSSIRDIITESNSPWMAPAVFVPKKSGELAYLYRLSAA